ncbi:hypothetical protein M413DRAFT_28468 [Hebeloma cylindrosporum]|uniref:F-box domain-containing protein n=1 Tax=Hebeloma cylindrosporum TaxID=76867 RepID=A0A0C3C900_HEBCY|nr:hypothetical protein M413DRAFT_28468 [Hebeloma cylindrosporum h7]
MAHLGNTIQALNNKILGRIFSFNATGCYSDLTTARHTSQVCTSWRQIILDVPSIWGNLIDLGCLLQKSDAWRNEVLHRAGNADLAIHGPIWCITNPEKFVIAEKFLELLISNHWTRIYWLDVTFPNFHRPTSWSGACAWRAIESPAPKLTFFSICFGDDMPSTFSSPSFTLFAHDAPQLTHFKQNHIPIDLSKISSSICLTSLTLDSVSNFNLGIILKTCSQMYLLQSLDLLFGTKPGASPSLEGPVSQTDLPLLSSLHINAELRFSMAFLDHVEPCPGCSLNLLTHDDVSLVPRITADEFLTIRRIIGKHANNYLCLWSPPRDFLFRSDHQAYFIDIMLGEVTVHIRCALQVDATPDRPISALYFDFLKTVDPVYIAGVKEFALISFLVLPFDQQSMDFFRIAMPDLEELSITTSSLVKLLEAVEPDFGGFFLQLRKIVWLAEDTVFPDITELIERFLTNRQNLGIPIQEIDLTDWAHRGRTPPISRALPVWFTRPFVSSIRLGHSR